jgi:hypothetical protein
LDPPSEVAAVRHPLPQREPQPDEGHDRRDDGQQVMCSRPGNWDSTVINI